MNTVITVQEQNLALSSILNRWLNRLYKSIAVILVLFAVLISALRILLPYADNYHQHLENYLKQSYQHDITIGGLSMEWSKYGPLIIVKKVNLLNQQGVDASIKKLELGFDFWLSLQTQTLVVNNLFLVGANVTVDKALLLNRDDNTNNQALALDELTNFFMTQISRFSIKNSHLKIQSEQTPKTLLINQLTWANFEERHLADANIIVDTVDDTSLQNSVKILLDITGNTRKNISGQLYVDAYHLDLLTLINELSTFNSNVPDTNASNVSVSNYLTLANKTLQASMNFNAWLDIDKGQAKQLQVAFNDTSLNWQSDDAREQNAITQEAKAQDLAHQDNKVLTEHNFTLHNGQFLLSNLDDIQKLSLSTSPITVSFDKKQWPLLNIDFKQSATELFGYISYADLTSLSHLLPLFSNNDAINTALAAIQLQGEVSDFNLQHEKETPWNNVTLTTHFSHLNSRYYQGIPGIKNSQGDIIWANEQININLTADDGALDFSHHFIQPLPYERLEASINANVNEDGWQLSSDHLLLTSEELQLSAELVINAPVASLAEMSLLASITQGSVEFAHHYFPLSLMSEELVTYLKKGLVGGDINQALILINGPLANFPFEDKSGIFIVDAELTHSTFNFDDRWPDITELEANLNFTNNSMKITGRTGNLVGLEVNGVDISIDDLKDESVLTVDYDFTKVRPQAVTELMLKSPLKQTVGATLTDLVIGKDISGKFNLTLPLKNIDNTVARGVINFNNNTLALKSPAIDFSQLKGTLHFVNDVISTENLQLTWNNLPLALAVTGSDDENSFNTRIHIDANWAEKLWQPYVPSSLQQYVEGKLNWQGDLQLHNHHDGNFSYDVNIQTPLKGIALTLPHPYNKLASQNMPLIANVNGQSRYSSITVSMGENLNFEGQLTHASSVNTPVLPTHFSRANLTLGQEKMVLPTEGFHITTTLDKVAFSSWQPFLTDVINTINQYDEVSTVDNTTLNNEKQVLNTTHIPFIKSPERIRGTIAEFDFIDQKFTDVAFNLYNESDGWLLQLNANELRSKIKFYPQWMEQGIDIDAEFLRLSNELPINENTNTVDDSDNSESLSTTSTEPLTDYRDLFASIPPMRVNCDDCKINQYDLGQVAFEVTRSKSNSIELVDFLAKRKKTSFTSHGVWKLIDQDPSVLKSPISITQLEGKLVIDDVETEMKKLGFASNIKDSGAKFNFALNWQGGPQDFALKQLNGQFDSNFDDGYLSDVSDKGARVFSILSLGSLVRKLKLDFRDIFSDGMFYSSIKGDFEVKNGILYTDNAKMDGAAGDLNIKGNTELSTGILDYSMSYKPNLTSSLPVLAWVATLNPVVFLTGLAINEVITSKVISEFEFELTGDVNEPNLREVNRKTKDVTVGKSTPPTILEDEAISTQTPEKTPAKKFTTEQNNVEKK